MLDYVNMQLVFKRYHHPLEKPSVKYYVRIQCVIKFDNIKTQLQREDYGKWNAAKRTIGGLDPHIPISSC